MEDIDPLQLLRLSPDTTRGDQQETCGKPFRGYVSTQVFGVK
jgi:hypothetical protein